MTINIGCREVGMTEKDPLFDNIVKLYDLFDVDPGISAFLKGEAIHQRGWGALLFEHRLEGDASRAVAAACKNAGFSTALCVDIDEHAYETRYISLDPEGIGKARYEFHTPSYAIIEADEKFFIVSDNDYYWSIAGERNFVESVFDVPWEKLLGDFEVGIRPYTQAGNAAERRISQNLLKYLDICRSSFVADHNPVR
jgi:hypothetical protein